MKKSMGIEKSVLVREAIPARPPASPLSSFLAIWLAAAAAACCCCCFFFFFFLSNLTDIWQTFGRHLADISDIRQMSAKCLPNVVILERKKKKKQQQQQQQQQQAS
jgi:hypothetical protein